MVLACYLLIIITLIVTIKCWLCNILFLECFILLIITFIISIYHINIYIYIYINTYTYLILHLVSITTLIYVTVCTNLYSFLQILRFIRLIFYCIVFSHFYKYVLYIVSILIPEGDGVYPSFNFQHHVQLIWYSSFDTLLTIQDHFNCLHLV